MFNTTVNAVSDPLTRYWNGFVDYLPYLLGGIAILIVGLIVASIIANIFERLLSLGESNQKVQQFLSKWGIKLQLSKFVGRFVWWAIFLVFIGAAVDVLHIPIVSSTLMMLVGYLPSLFAAAVIATIVFIGARVVRSLIQSALDGVGFDQAKTVATTAYVALLVFGLTAAVAQLGVDTTLLTANITVIIGGVVLALALAFGLGGRETAGKIVAKWYESGKTTSKKK
ncbi:hypothetical protein CR969_01080 [Candidatus Saccharibacteria bacterium]|nr:MAG: hypothetical protein CR969_01080 [Candidatus Saccharibacteria bacterium]